MPRPVLPLVPLRHVVAGASIALVALTLAGCNACEKLEAKVCMDLGPDDCAIWREDNGPAATFAPRGRKNRGCMNVSTGPAYDETLAEAKALVAARRAARAAGQQK